MFFEALALILGAIHFAVPLVYFAYLKKYLLKPWNIEVDEEYVPTLTVIVPTYNESKTIKNRLDNIYELDYPKSKVETLVIDSASTDGTLELVTKWVKNHRDIQLKVVEQSERRGKISALNLVLGKLTEKTEIVVMTDSDCVWNPLAMKNAVKYLADPSVGAVTCSIKPMPSVRSFSTSFDEKYRDYNNLLRVAESKGYSTPIAHGPLIAYKRELLDKIGGIPLWSGADDSTLFTLVILQGYRSIQVPEVVTYEYVPKIFLDNIKRRVRRAQHLVEHFVGVGRKMRRLPSINRLFKRIFQVEKYFHIINPWLLILSFLSLITASIIRINWLSLTISISFFLILAISRVFRTWVITQLILVFASTRYILIGNLVKWEPVKR